MSVQIALAAEVERLRAELADLQDGYSRLSRDFALAIESDSKHIAELAEAKRDAERYRRLCSLVAWGKFGVCRVQSNEEGDDYADDGDMLDAWLDDPEMIAEAQAIDAYAQWNTRATPSEEK